MYDKENHHFSGVKADIFSLGVLLLNLITNKYGSLLPKEISDCYKHIVEGKHESFLNPVKANIIVDKLSEVLKNL